MSGWDLPPGSRDSDPDAPWNASEPTCDTCCALTVDCECKEVNDDDN